VNGTLKTTDGTPIADAESTAESALRQIIDVLEQVMCTHDAEKLAILCWKSMKHPNLTTQSYVFNFASELMQLSSNCRATSTNTTAYLARRCVEHNLAVRGLASQHHNMGTDRWPT
jgi:hypothetical protein